MTSSHFHNSCEIYYLLSGERYYFINNRTYHVTKGDLVLINANDLHRTIDSGMPYHKRLLINFSENFILNSNASIQALLSLLFMQNDHIIRFGIQDQKHIENLLYKMLEEVKQKYTGFEASLQALLLQLLVFTGRYIEANTGKTYEHPTAKHKKASEIVQYINGHYMEDITLPFISEHFYISQYHLSRIFKEATGFTFIEFLSSVRIREAQKLLKETKYKVINISEKVGFGSIAHFGRVFKEVTGTTPLAYRKRY